MRKTKHDLAALGIDPKRLREVQKRLRETLGGMPCDNQDDLREVAINEILAEDAEIEMGVWQPTVPARPS